MGWGTGDTGTQRDPPLPVARKLQQKRAQMLREVVADTGRPEADAPEDEEPEEEPPWAGQGPTAEG